MKHLSVKLNSPCEFIEIVPINPLISKCQIKVCYVSDEPNRNKTVITKEFAKELANSLPGSPIVGLYNELTEDFEEHSREVQIEEDEVKLVDITRPYGFVDMNAKCWFQKFLDDNQHEREYLMTEGYLWTGQYPEAQRIIEKGNNQSMELDENYLNGSWAKDDIGKPSFFIINEAIISKLCILGEEFEPCFEGAGISNTYSLFKDNEEFNAKLFSMIQEISDILKNSEEGGKEMPNEENLELNPEVVEESVEETAVVVEIEEEAIIEEENAAPEYVLEEITEYVELSQDYIELEKSYEALDAQYKALFAEIASLKEFKQNVERNQKQDMINSFTMLSEEDKADVIKNIDTYTLDEIEAKLSVICVRNKVSFGLNTEQENTEPAITFSLTEQGNGEEASIPAWAVKALEVEKELG